MGSPISGATVTITGLPGGTVSGTTDGSGDYTSPSINSGDSGTLTVAYGGCTYTGTITTGSCGTLNLCYCETVTTVAVAGPAGGGVTLTENGTLVNDGDSTAIGTAVKVGTTWTFTLCNISVCESHFAPPASVAFVACATVPGWACACQTIHPACGTDTSITLTLYYWPDCYHDWTSPAAGIAPTAWGCCPPACTNPATGQGYYPKTINARFHSNHNRYASDNGVWIALTLVSDAVTVDPVTFIPTRTIVWDSGCRGGQGNYVSFPSTHLNEVVAGDTHQTSFLSTSVLLTTICRYGSGSKTFLQYKRWKAGGCTPTTSLPPGQCCFISNPTVCVGVLCDYADTLGGSCGDPSTCWSGWNACSTNSPVNASYDINAIVVGTVHQIDTVDLMEPACASTQVPTVVGDLGDTGGGLGG
jgi:hypothetical protein